MEDGAIIVEGNILRDIGKYEAISRSYHYDSELGSMHHIVIPGLINAHHHGRGLSAFQAGVRDAPLELWLPDLFRSYRVDPYWDALLAAMNLIKTGTTSVLCHYCERDPSEPSYPDDLEKALRAFLDSGIRLAFAPAVSDQNKYIYEVQKNQHSAKARHFESRVNDSFSLKRYFSTFDHLSDKYRQSDRVRFQYGPNGVQWCSDALLEEIQKKARGNDNRVHLHLLETKYQKKYGELTYGKSIVEHLNDINFLGPQLSVAHCVWLNDKDIELASRCGVTAIHNPSSNLRLYSGISPVLAMMQRRMRVAIGTDSTGLNDDDDLFQEMRLCWTLHRLPGIDSPRLTSSQVFDMVTGAGAKATGFAPEIGAIEIGKKADLVLLDSRRLFSPYMSPRIPVLDALLQRMRPADVDTVLVDGKVLLMRGKFTRFDESIVHRALEKSVIEPGVDELESIESTKKWIREFYSTWDANGGYATGGPHRS